MSRTRLALTYDDINLIPGYSTLASRQDADLSCQISRNYKLKIPLVASPMDTVCDKEMAIAMASLGGIGCIHRFMTIEEQANQLKEIRLSSWTQTVWRTDSVPLMAAIGANGDYLERAQELVNAGANIILIDVAHGHHLNVKNAINALKASLPSHIDIIAGSITTAAAGRNLEDWGADGLRVGVGNGSLCTTRIKTGFGVPSITAIEDIIEETTIPVMADGGIRSSGDIAKALAVGANTVMLGSLLAGTKESPGQIVEKKNGLYKRYRGSASLETKMAHGMQERNVEGESTVIPFKGGVKFIVDGLLDGVRSAISYAGATSLEDFHPEYVQVTQAGMTEARPHLL